MHVEATFTLGRNSCFRNNTFVLGSTRQLKVAIVYAPSRFCCTSGADTCMVTRSECILTSHFTEQLHSYLPFASVVRIPDCVRIVANCRSNIEICHDLVHFFFHIDL